MKSDFSIVKAQLTQVQISANLSQHKSKISREISSNSGLRGYRPGQACRLAANRALNSRNARPIADADWLEVKGYLKDQWSPEQITLEVSMSHETIYRHIFADKAMVGNLYKSLRCQRKRRKRHASGRDRRWQIPGRRPICERPRHVEERRQIRHWEGDTLIGKRHNHAIVSLVERKSGYAVLAKVEKKTADLVSVAIIKRLKPISNGVQTLTYDNGKEFADHAAIDKALGSTTCFADPCSSWQRGSDENLNGLIRQYIPKARALSTVTDVELQISKSFSITDHANALDAKHR